MRPILFTTPLSTTPAMAADALSLNMKANTSGSLVSLMNSQTPFVLSGHQTLFREGDDAESVFLLLAGSIRLFNFMANGRRLVARFVFPGDIFGLSFGKDYPFTAEAIKSAVVAKIPRSKLTLLCDHSSSLRDDIIILLKQELHTAQHDILPMMHQNAEQRIARLLMMLARRNGANLTRGREIHVSMTRTDIADFLGLTVETVCRGFTKLKHDRLISADASDIIRVEDADNLLALAESEH